MMDVQVASKLGLEMERATRHQKFGSFWGPGGKEMFYYGRIKGPVTIRVAEGVEYTVDEVKVLQHSVPLFIIGTDALVESKQAWRFCWVGLHPVHKRGIRVFVDQAGTLVEIPLAYWPCPIGDDGKRIIPAEAH